MRAKLWKAVARPVYLFIILQLIFELGFALNALSSGAGSVWILHQVWLTPVFYGGLAYFIGVQVLLYLALIGFQVLVFASLVRFAQLTLILACRLARWFSVLALIAIFFANHHFYPNSVFSFWSHNSFFSGIDAVVFGVILIIWLCLLAVSFFLVLRAMVMHSKTLWGGLIIIALILVHFGWHHVFRHKVQHKLKQPNIIIIGLDAVRPAWVMQGKATMPYLKAYLQQSVYFSRTLTPLARTFPAWVSILGGDYPKKNGARYSLPQFSAVHVKNNLAYRLDAQSYQTYFSIDERLFNNIDNKHFGFHHFIGAPYGINDFLLSSFNDFPLSNLILNTKLGHYLFRYNYGNRAAATTYDPDAYLQRFNQGFSFNPNKPVFLGIHLCLAHWPFIWKDFDGEVQTEAEDQAAYLKSLKRLDLQFHALMQLLQKRGLLQNAIVIVISDHGQGFENKNELYFNVKDYHGRKINPALFKVVTTPLNGHGTNILQWSQNDALMSFKRYGATEWKLGKVKQQVMLIDIAPTVLQLLKLQPTKTMQGQSLVPLLLGKVNKQSIRPFFLETGFTLPGILAAKKSVKKILAQGLNYFMLNTQTGRVLIKPQVGKWILQGKQRGIIQGQWFYVHYPLNGVQYPLLINLKTKAWTLDMQNDFAKQSPFLSLQQQLKTFYGSELKDGGE